MRITDLSYLEDISEANYISGSASVAVSGSALALGAPTSTLVDLDTTAKTTPGVSKAKGRVTAIAIGDVTAVGIDVSGEGDKVIEKTKVKYFENKDMTIAKGFVMAIDHL